MRESPSNQFIVQCLSQFMDDVYWLICLINIPFPISLQFLLLKIKVLEKHLAKSKHQKLNPCLSNQLGTDSMNLCAFIFLIHLCSPNSIKSTGHSASVSTDINIFQKGVVKIRANITECQDRRKLKAVFTLEQTLTVWMITEASKF